MTCEPTPVFDAVAAEHGSRITVLLAATPLPADAQALTAALTSRRRGPRRARKGKA